MLRHSNYTLIFRASPMLYLLAGRAGSGAIERITYREYVISRILRAVQVISRGPSGCPSLSSTLRIFHSRLSRVFASGPVVLSWMLEPSLESYCHREVEIEPEPTRRRESDAFAEAKRNLCGGCLPRERITRSPRPLRSCLLMGSSLSGGANGLFDVNRLSNSKELSNIDWFWTSGGKALGYREADALFSCEGHQIGHFRGDEIYGRDGSYLGEVARTGRLVTQLNKLRWRKSGFFPSTAKPLDPPGDVTSEHVVGGFRDFKVPG